MVSEVETVLQSEWQLQKQNNQGQRVSVSDNLWHELVEERIEDVKKLAAYLKQDPDWSVVDTGDRDISKL